MNNVMTGGRRRGRRRRTTKFPNHQNVHAPQDEAKHVRKGWNMYISLLGGWVADDGGDLGAPEEKKGRNIIEMKKKHKEAKKGDEETTQKQPTQINPAAKVKSNKK